MDLEDSYRILGIDAGSTEEERFKAYEELRERLNAKLANAPTSGLKEKYSMAFKQLDEAIEIVESSFDEKEMPIFNMSASAPDSLPIGGEDEVPVPIDPAERRKRSGLLWIGLGVLIIAGVLFVSSVAWQRHVENEAQRVAAIELDRAREVEKAELATAQQEFKPLKKPYETFSRKLDTALENAVAINAELETARGVAEREGTQSERELSNFRFKKHSEYVIWLREYLENYSVAEALNAAENFIAEGKVDAAKSALEIPIPDFDKLQVTMEESKQEKYESPLKEFLAKQEYNRALDISEKALSRLDFVTGLEALKPYENREYVKEQAQAELEKLYRLKHEDTLKKAQHAAEIGEFQLARSLLDTLEGEPVADEHQQERLNLVERLNAEYALEEATLASRQSLERNAFEEARVQLTYLLENSHVEDRAKLELEEIAKLEKAWQAEQEAIKREAELARLINDGENESPISADFDQPPQLLSKVDPLYPDFLRRSGVSGFVELEWQIGVDGRTRDVDVISSSRYEYEIPAVEAVKRWRFKPAEKDGEPVASKVRQKVLFNPR